MLIIDGNQVYEIDEECLKHRNPPAECGVWEMIAKTQEHTPENTKSNHKTVRKRSSANTRNCRSPEN